MLEPWLAFFHISAVLGWIVFASAQAALCRTEWLNAAVVPRLVRLDVILWTISKRGVVATQPEALTRAATQEATAHCAVQGKRFRQIDLKESPPGLLAPRAETALTFVCE